MPTPSPVPTAAQTVTVAEITMLPVATVSTMIAADDDQAVSDAKWALTLTDIASWSSLRDETDDIKKVGPIEFFENAGAAGRIDFRNRLRTRYGQLPLRNEFGADPAGFAAAAVTVTNDY